MFKKINLNIGEFSRQIMPEWLRPIRIIFLALNGGVIFFNLICLVLYFNNSGYSGEAENVDLVYLFLIVEAVFIAFLYLPFKIIPERMARRETAFDPTIPPAQNVINLYISYMIIKVALLEGAALFGSVVFFTGVTNYTIYKEPITWLSIIPTFILIVYSIFNFPTVERITLFYDKYKQ